MSMVMGSPKTISDLLTKTIEDFDKSILDDLLALLPKNFEELDDDLLKRIVNDQELGGKVYNACIRCMRGSTAILTLIDPGKKNLWVANLGDSQASKYLTSSLRIELFDEGIFAGLAVCSATRPNDFKAVILTSPHNSNTEVESERIRSEHPGEPEAVLKGRVLGSQGPSRG